jgi:SAM-dependent methyltransferase
MFKKVVKKFYYKCKALISGVFWYSGDIFRYKGLLKKAGVAESFYYFPQIFDKAPESHTFDKHYVNMDRWAFKHLLNTCPQEHVDVGSSIRFLSMASTVTKVKFVDIRPINPGFDNFEGIEGSILNMPFADNSVNSLSCLHVAEHIGLGRYGDPLDPLGTMKSCVELARVLAPGGQLYFALPVGKNATYFNAHRVHSPLTILEYFKGLKLVEFSAVGDDGHFRPHVKPEDYVNANYACGCFKFTK